MASGEHNTEDGILRRGANASNAKSLNLQMMQDRWAHDRGALMQDCIMVSSWKGLMLTREGAQQPTCIPTSMEMVRLSDSGKPRSLRGMT